MMMDAKRKITTKQIGLFLTAIGQTMAEGLVKRAYTVEEAVRNDETTISRMVSNGMGEDEARYLHAEIDFGLTITKNLLAEDEEVTS